MTREDQNNILDDKIESNINQYKVDILSAEISTFPSGDLNKYEFLTRKDLKYKSNALAKARFEFSPLGQTFSTGLDKTAQGYQEEGVIKLLKDFRDGLAGVVNRRPDDGFDDDEFDDYESDTTPYDTPYTSDDEDDIKNNKKIYDNLLLKHFQLRKNMKETKDELDKTKMIQAKNHRILMVSIKIVFIKMLMEDMILMVLIKMVFIKILIINIILMVFL